MKDTRPTLLRIHPPLSGQRMEVHAIGGDAATLGRSPDCGVPIQGMGISGVHCSLQRNPETGRLRVADLNSRNGTFVNGWRVPEGGADCVPESVIRIGDVLFIYRELTSEDGEAARLPPLPGPVHTRHRPLVDAVERIEEYRTSGGPIWLAGPPGCGRSVLEKHLERLGDEAVWMLESEGSSVIFEVHACASPPPEALAPRVVIFPPLRDRIEDLGILIRSLCAPRKVQFTPRMLEAIHLYDWPGNIRELRIMVERAFHPVWGSMPGAAWDIAQFPDIAHYLDRRPKPPEGLLPRSAAYVDPSSGAMPAGVSSTQLRQHMESKGWKLFDASSGLGVSRATLVEALAGAGIRGPAQGLPGTDTGQAPPGLG
jgi:hypothetical protein